MSKLNRFEAAEEVPEKRRRASEWHKPYSGRGRWAAAKYGSERKTILFHVTKPLPSRCTRRDRSSDVASRKKRNGNDATRERGENSRRRREHAPSALVHTSIFIYNARRNRILPVWVKIFHPFHPPTHPHPGGIVREDMIPSRRRDVST